MPALGAERARWFERPEGERNSYRGHQADDPPRKRRSCRARRKNHRPLCCLAGGRADVFARASIQQLCQPLRDPQAESWSVAHELFELPTMQHPGADVGDGAHRVGATCKQQAQLTEV